MDNKLFNFNNHSIRIVINENNEPLFVAKDVCDVLGYKNGRDAIKDNCKIGGVATSYIPHPQSKDKHMEVTVINESNLYRLILKSKKKEAEKFESWVCDEVLPSIRKHGIYATDKTLEDMINSPDLVIGLATQLKLERQEKALLQSEVNRMKPRDEFVDKFFEAKDLLKVSEVAKCLNIKGIGRNNLYQILRDKGILCLNNEPKQEYVNRGYFEVKMEFVEQINEYRPTIFVTKKGFGWLSKILGVIETCIMVSVA